MTFLKKSNGQEKNSLLIRKERWCRRTYTTNPTEEKEIRLVYVGSKN